jgi:hypothetical protein
MGNHSCENGVDKKETAADGKGAAAPARELHVTLGHDGRIVRETKLVGGKREAKIGLGEGGDGATEMGSHGGSRFLVSSDWDEGTLVEVDSEACSSREII